jgi:hypothetical protein
MLRASSMAVRAPVICPLNLCTIPGRAPREHRHDPAVSVADPLCHTGQRLVGVLHQGDDLLDFGDDFRHPSAAAEDRPSVQPGRPPRARPCRALSSEPRSGDCGDTRAPDGCRAGSPAADSSQHRDGVKKCALRGDHHGQVDGNLVGDAVPVGGRGQSGHHPPQGTDQRRTAKRGSLTASHCERHRHLRQRAALRAPARHAAAPARRGPGHPRIRPPRGEPAADTPLR